MAVTVEAQERDPHDYVVRGSHRVLLEPVPPPAPVSAVPGPGLVMVPAARTHPLLDSATAIARALGWPLLVVCSHEARAPDVRRQIQAAGGDVTLTAADLLHRRWLRAHRDWQAVDHPAARQRRDIDTNRKRNLGLAAAAMTGARHVLFVDDDITHLTPGAVTAALAAMPSRDAVVTGWPLESFADNSVVHHARRDVLGREQDVFIGGGALLVDLERWTPTCFPPCYNEDWLFLFDPLVDRRVLCGSPAVQLPYDPYADPDRAGLEEFGDVLGEGLFHLLHEDLPVDEATETAYWDSVRASRRALLERITEALRGAGPPLPAGFGDRVAPALAAVESSRHQLARATPTLLADFVRRWRRDQATWSEFYEGLKPHGTLKDALVRLGLDESWVVTHGT